MAKKALFHRVKFQNGHGTWDAIRAAPSRASIEARHTDEHVKVVDVKCLGFCSVSAEPDQSDELLFRATVGGEDVLVAKGDPGHDYLSQQFPDQVRSVQDFLQHGG